MRNYKMLSKKRYHELMNGGELTQEEKNYGWHFCEFWDGLLINENDPEIEACACDLRWRAG